MHVIYFFISFKSFQISNNRFEIWLKCRGQKKFDRIKYRWKKSNFLFSVFSSEREFIISIPKINFELPHNNDKFIEDGLHLITSAQNGELDKCNHRIVFSLKDNCNRLNTEQIGKLAVLLLNCQLESEGRDSVLCHDEMVRWYISTFLTFFMFFS